MNKIEAIKKATNSVLADKVLTVAGKEHELARCAFIHLALEAGATVPEVANAIKATHAVVCGENMLVKNLGDNEIVAFKHVVVDFFFNLSDHFPIFTDVKIG